MAERELLVRILGDDRDLQQALGSTNRRLEQIDNRTQTFGRNIGRAFTAAGVAIGTSEIISLAGSSVDAASDLNEQIDRTRVVLGDASEEMIRWSETTATAMGISQRAALAAAGTFAGLFQTVGTAPDESGELSRSLVQLAADLASLQNTSPEEALLALRSGLVGEAEPLRRFNIFLSETRVQQQALADTGKRAASALTTQEKTLARYNIILQDSVLAQGNFNDTQGSLANQTRIFRASLDDLSTNIGGVLLPVMQDAVETANLLFIALDKFRGVDFSPGFDFPEPPDWIKGFASAAAIAPISPLGAAIAGVKNAVESDNEEAQSVLGEIIGSTTKTIDALVAAMEKQADALQKQQRAAAGRSARDFAAFVKGLGLKLDKAGLTEGLDDDLAALRELESAIVRRIAVEGRTFKLVSQLVSTRREINATIQRIAADAEQAGEDAFNATVDALTLDLDVARATQSLADDQAALRALEQAILRRISTEGQTTDLMRQLFNVRQEQKDVAQRLADQQRERRRGRQFEALGLTEEGTERAPSARSLKQRGESLEERIRGTALDTKKNRQILENAARVLSGQFGKVGRDVRLAIKGMFDDIANALNDGDSKVGPLTKTSGLNTKKILSGLGLSADEINELRGRLSGFNTAGRELAGLGAAGPRRTTTGATIGTGTIFLESTTTINLDGQQVARVVTKQQQKTRRRNPAQKRGPNRKT